jgi:hypothetical protein
MAIAAAFALALQSGCDDDHHSFVCANDTCWCGRGAECVTACAAPPCHLECLGDNPRCDGECANGDCVCGEASQCDFACQSPPCHVDCKRGADCSGQCANGTCTCERGASCELTCNSGPCHVRCAGDNPRCDGECANGSCTCEAGSTCRFTCIDHNCSATCAAGASCVLDCPLGRAGTQGCTFTTCAAGSPTVCPDGFTVTCGAPCPVQSANVVGAHAEPLGV